MRTAKRISSRSHFHPQRDRSSPLQHDRALSSLNPIALSKFLHLKQRSPFITFQNAHREADLFEIALHHIPKPDRTYSQTTITLLNAITFHPILKPDRLTPSQNNDRPSSSQTNAITFPPFPDSIALL